MIRRVSIAFTHGMALLLVAGLPAHSAAPAVDIDMIIASSAAGGGALVLRHDFGLPVLVTPSFSSDGMTRYTTTQPGFEALDRPEGGLFPLKNGTPVRMEVAAADPGVSFKIGATSLDAVAEAAPIGEMPNLHVHGEWRLLLPDGVVETHGFAFRLTTTARGYADSPVYTFSVTNSPTGGGGSPTTTTTLPAPAATRLSGALLALRPVALVVRSRDSAVGLAGAGADVDDPTLVGGELRVVAETGVVLDLRHDLPAVGWRAVGKGHRRKGYRYRDPAGRFGPITKVTVRRGKGMTVVGKRMSLAPALVAEPDGVSVVLGLGSQRYCMRFGGRTHFRSTRLFEARDAPPPPACLEEP
jgi:hypothetical protein